MRFGFAAMLLPTQIRGQCCGAPDLACHGLFGLALPSRSSTAANHDPFLPWGKHETHVHEGFSCRRRFAADRRHRGGIHGEDSVSAVAGVLAGRRHRRREDRLDRGTDRDARQRRPRYLEQFRGAGEAGVLADGSDHEARRRQPRQHRAGDGVHQGVAIRRPLRRDAQGLLPEWQLSGERAHHGDELRAAGHRDRDPVGRCDRRPLLERPSLLGRRPGVEEIAGGYDATHFSTRIPCRCRCRQHLARPWRRPRARADRQVRPRHQGRRSARHEPEVARAARRRHPQRGDRGAGGGHPGGAREADPRREGQARPAGPDRHARARLSAGLGDWPTRGRAGGVHGDHDLRERGRSGFPVGEMLNIDYADVDQAAKTLAENPELVLGIKVRETVEVVGTNGLEPLRRAILACERSGVRGARVMCHIGNAPGELSALLDLLRPGDILTHAYSGAGNNTVRDGKVLAAALAAKKRGVLIDVGHGGGSFDYTVAEPAIAQGFTPDTIGSDIHAVSGNTPGMPYLPWVMSKFLNLGFSLEQVVAMATAAPARIIGKVDKLGTLAVGAPADVSILELVEGPVDFVDTRKNSRKGSRYLKPIATVRAGRPFGRPYPSPFSYP